MRFIGIFLLLSALICSASASATRTLVIFGSSTPAGIGASNYSSSWAGRLSLALAPMGWRVVNRSTPGDSTTTAIARFRADVVGLRPDACLLAFTLGNENLAYASDPAATISRYVSNCETLISMCRSENIVPILAAPWPRNDYNLPQKAGNMEVGLWMSVRSDLYTIDLHSPVVSASGSYLAGVFSDELHPNDGGHAAMFAAIPTTIFHGDLTPPIINNVRTGGIEVGASDQTPITLAKIDGLASFTLAACIAPAKNGSSYMAVGRNAGVHLINNVWVFTDEDRKEFKHPSRGLGAWDHIAISYNSVTNAWVFAVNGIRVGSGSGKLDSSEFALFGTLSHQEIGLGQLRDLTLHRVALPPEHIAALAAGTILRGSLEVWSPCGQLPISGRISNLAGTGTAFYASPTATYSSLTHTQAAVVNLSARVFVGRGQQAAVIGFTVGGVGSRKVLLRAAGPALRQFGIDQPLTNPTLEVKSAAGELVAFNDSWDSDADRLVRASESVGAFPFLIGDSDAAVVIELQPGNYTAVVRGAGEESGIALLEVYQMPN